MERLDGVIALRLWVGVGLLVSCGGQAADGGERIPPAPGVAVEHAPPQTSSATAESTSKPPPVPAAAPTAPDPILAAPQAVPVTDLQDVPVPGELRLAMEELAEALREADAARALGKFSRAGGFRYADTRRTPPAIQSLAFERLARELTARSGVYHTLFDATGLRRYVSGANAIPWLGIASDEFAPRGGDSKKVWVRWRAEGEAWFVDTIALPAALSRGR